MDETKPPSSAGPESLPPVAPETAPADAVPVEAAPAADGATPAPPAKPVKAKKEKKEESWWDTIRFLLWLFLAAVVLRTFLFAPFSIP